MGIYPDNCLLGDSLNLLLLKYLYKMLEQSTILKITKVKILFSLKSFCNRLIGIFTNSSLWEHSRRD